MIKKFNDFINEDFTDLYNRWKNKEVRKEDKDNTNYIDLGLPSGTLWADRNLGASSPVDYGDYYAWGETEPKDDYSWNTYKWKFGKDCTKYNEEDGKKVLEPEDDVVYLTTKGKAHIPTKEQIQELLDNTTSKITTINGVKGRLFTSKVNDNFIFIPFSGHQDGSSIDFMGSWFACWSSSPDLDGFYYAHHLMSSFGGFNVGAYARYYGFSVRGVKDKQ